MKNINKISGNAHLCLAITCLLAIAPFVRLHAAEYSVSPAADTDCSDLVCNLQSALTDAGGNGQDDLILIEPGTYDLEPPAGTNLDYDPLSSEDFSIQLLGTGEGEKILEGRNRSAGQSILWIKSVGGETVIKGITFQNGLFSNISGLFVEGNGAVTIEGCNFISNQGGASISGNAINVIRNKFLNNSGEAYGGLRISRSFGLNTLTLEGNVFAFNSAELPGGTGGALVDTQLATITNNVFSRNVGIGALISIKSDGFNPLIVNNTFSDNQSNNEGTLVGGMALSLDDDTLEADIFNNIAVNSVSPSGNVISDIFFNAGADFDGDGKGSSFELRNNNFGKLSTSCFEGCSIPKEESDNINKDPLFVDPENGDFRLSPSSPCVNAGTADVALVDLPEFDLDGNPRTFGSAPDMGAYELQEEPAPSSGGSGNGTSGGCSLIH